MLKSPHVIERNKNFENGDTLYKEYFRYLSSLGAGAFGKVYKVSPK